MSTKPTREKQKECPVSHSLSLLDPPIIGIGCHRRNCHSRAEQRAGERIRERRRRRCHGLLTLINRQGRPARTVNIRLF